ncbi:Na+/H+ antiporter subunit E [Sphingopyxis flava]|uniref:Multisubunit potassium/proton antiporter, PhaE subunit n=1 Tax=Sphingopyxis flava TaxID=1507287 RepID=A0A1T5B4R4_9SPHN|nr:Na+/H+ antiporter subunit E [Sphingopyxis flava]SKB42251.1 multisubunit potassium/proton antiporter, PhaE subunit [Sphingopyxis flava]
MNRLFPYPVLTLALFVMWILLTGFSPGHVLLGGLVAALVSRTMLSLKPEPTGFRPSLAIFRLAGLVLADIVRSNFAVARIILFKPAERHSGFLHLPVELRNPYALAVLAVIITATPGTLWVQHDARRHVILIHVLDLIDEETWIRFIKDRYERLLLEIFE